jgi:CRISPR-associated protein Csy3
MAKAAKKKTDAPVIAIAVEAECVIPKFLNYNRSISVSTGYFHGRRADGTLVPVEVTQTTKRGSTSSMSNGLTNAFEPIPASEEDQKDIRQSNVMTVDEAFLPGDCRTLVITYGFTVLPKALAPSACGSIGFRSAMGRFAEVFSQKGGFRDLAGRYLWNVANGRTIWRNDALENLRAEITCRGVTVVFDCHDIAIDAYPGEDAMPEGFSKLVDMFGEALGTKSRRPTIFSVELSGDTNPGTEVYPSQEFVREEMRDKSPHPNKRQLSYEWSRFGERNIRHATLHSQKIGNAIRTIDQWHDHVEEYGTTAVEPFGFVQSRMSAVRAPDTDAGKSFYEIVRDVDSLTARIEKGPIDDDARYVGAVLVRGGVFSSGKTKPKTKNGAGNPEADNDKPNEEAA